MAGRHIAEEHAPIFSWSIGGDQGGPGFVAADEEFQQILGRQGPNRFMPKSSITNKSTRCRAWTRARRWLTAVASAKSTGEVEDAAHADAVTGADRPDRDRRGGVRLAHARWTNQQDAAPLGHETPGGQARTGGPGAAWG